MQRHWSSVFILNALWIVFDDTTASIEKAFLNIRFLGSSTIINFIWTPVLAWGLGAIFLSDHPALWIGFIMLMVTPCTDWYLAFTGIAKGNVSLSTSILPINLILQVVLLPIYLLLFAGSIETILSQHSLRVY